MTLLLFVLTLAHAVRAPQARPGSDPSLLLQDELTRTNGSLYETRSISKNPFHRAGFGVDLALLTGQNPQSLAALAEMVLAGRR